MPFPDHEPRFETAGEGPGGEPPAPGPDVDEALGEVVQSHLSRLVDSGGLRGARACLARHGGGATASKAPPVPGDDVWITSVDPRFRCAGCGVDRAFVRSATGSTGSAPAPPCGPRLATPIRFARTVLGLLVVDDARAEAEASCRTVAAELARDLEWIRTNHRASRELPGSVGLVGQSPHLRRLGLFIERAALRSLPVLIEGEPGTETEELAFAIHAASARHGPFLKVDCAAFTPGSLRSELEDLLTLAGDGTVLFANLGALPPADQAWLARELRILAHHWLEAGDLDRSSPLRLVGSITVPPGRDPGGAVDLDLRSEFDFLRGRIDPLRLRREDIRPLASEFLRRLCGARENTFTDGAWQCLEQHDWPGNVRELRCLVVRLAGLTESWPVSAREVAAWLPTSPRLPVSGDPGTRPLQEQAPGPRSSAAGRDLVLHCSEGREPAVGLGHEALDRAVALIARSFAEPLTLAQIARRGFVSPSHLSHLFRRELKTSPMAFLSAVRLERARRWLLSEPEWSVTRIAGAAGFGDLRHFERQFKRRFRASPSQVRSGRRS